MPTNYYPQLTDPANQPAGETQLLAYLDALQKRGTTGWVFDSTLAGIRNTRSFSGAARPEVELRRVRYSLWLINPDQYADPYSERIRRTRARYLYS